MIKQKKCKGQGQANEFEGCGRLTPVENRKYGLCPSCLPKFYYSTDKGKEIVKKAILKACKPRKDFEVIESIHKQEKSLKLAKNNTKIVVHAYVRERDKGKPCISCGASWSESFQAGHYFKAETFETLKYNLDNINGQCQQCNIHFEGNFDNYTLNLPNRIGEERFKKLTALASIDKHFSKVWDLEKLKEIRDNVKKLKK